VRNYRNALSREAMLDWYRGIDVLLCTSINEGTPSPIFEAASCSRTIVSTDVGCVAEWRIPHDLGLIAPTYHDNKTAVATIDKLTFILSTLCQHRYMLRMLSTTLRKSVVAQYSYHTLVDRYLNAIAGVDDGT